VTGFVAPAYHDRSLGDVLPAVATALGVDAGLAKSSLEFPQAQAYVVFLVDGLGYELLQSHASSAPYLASLADGTAPATVGVPSTTATSLTSFGTALTPGTHGVVGFTSRIPGTNDLLNALTWSKNVDPTEWQPHQTAFAKLTNAGVHTAVVNKREFASSGLTVAGSRGAEYIGADKLGERTIAVLSAAGRRPSVTYMYDGDLDWTGHRYGVDSAQWRAQLEMIDASAEHLRETLPASVRLVVVADHGMVDSPQSSRVDVDNHPDLREGVAVLGGEARFRHVYCRGGAVADVLATWLGFFGDRALVLSRDEALAKGWFGELTPAVRPRLGDVVVACRGDAAIITTTDFPYENMLIGMHGSLTSVEMLIPILVD
jgi:hypothetical protein